MLSIFNKELRAFFSSATGYIVIAVFLILNGLLLWVIPGQYNIIETGYANVDGLFYLAPWLYLFLCPAVTMRLFAEEKQTGTWELLVTKPITKWQLVFAKFLSSWVLVALALIPTIVYYLSVYYIAEPFGNVDSGAFWGSFIGLLFLALLYVAIGTFASSLSKNQIVSFISALVLSFFFYYGFDLLASVFASPSLVSVIESFGIHYHYKSMCRGVIDTRDVSYFVIASVVFLQLTVVRIKK